MSEHPDRFAFLPGETAEERDDRLRGPGYTASCLRTEALTFEDIWGPDGEPPFPPIAPFRTSDAAHAAEDVTDPNPAPLPTDPWGSPPSTETTRPPLGRGSARDAAPEATSAVTPGWQTATQVDPESGVGGVA